MNRLRARVAAGQESERGDAMIIWCLGLALLLLPLGGISLDLWHAVSQERALQSDASAAADAGASGINTTSYRRDGQVVLDPSVAVSLAETNLAEQHDLPPLSAAPIITVSPGDGQVTVELQADVRLTLLQIVEGNRPIHIVATGSAAPRPSGAP